MEFLEGHKVVTAHEMLRIEGMAYAKGASESLFMENAGGAIAERVEEFISWYELDHHVILLVGKGNNGGDAYVAGRKLLQLGFTVEAVHLFALENCSPLCRQNHDRFKEAGGHIHYLFSEKKYEVPTRGIILDGLVGTGFQGKAEGLLAEVIAMANESILPIIAIDIPSGVNGNTGEVGTVAIDAMQTIYLGLPKIGFFIGEGWNHVGELVHGDFGLGEQFIEQAKVEACLINEEHLSSLIPPIKRTRHKYEAGYVLGVAGSPGMPGAAIMASFATLRAGAGIVRLFHPSGMEAVLSKAPLEVIREAWDLKNKKRIFEECKRARALFIGPGMGRTKASEKQLEVLLSRIELPCVIDADALYFIAHHPKWDIPENSILTPHHQEMKRLLEHNRKLAEKEVSFASCQKYAEEKNTTVVLKGAPTCIFHPKKVPLIIPRGDPGMATAGTGDVLTGVIAAMLAQKLEPRNAAAIGVFLHALSGEIAALEKTSYSMVASDLIDYLPEAFRELLL